MLKYKAFLFDLNGTMIDDMAYHVQAWYRILNECGANMSMEKAKEECYGKNHELLERVFPGRFSLSEKQQMSMEKEMQYQREFAPHLQLVAGLPELLEHYHQLGVKMAIGSAAIMSNIDFVIDGLNIRHYFDAIVSADDVAHSKPHPETYLKCAQLLNISATDCLVFEDVPKGVDAAANAGMDCFVLTTTHNREDFSQANIVGFASDFKKLSF